MDTGRILQKLDEYLHRNELDGAGRHLRYWLAEAKAAGNRGVETVLQNELIGLTRKTGNEQECLETIREVLADAELQKLLTLPEEDAAAAGSVSEATTLLNAATGLKAFGRAAEALPLYRRARRIYEKAFLPQALPAENSTEGAAADGGAETNRKAVDDRLAGLYNNMALCLADLGQFSEAEELYRRALDVLSGSPGSEPEQAVTWCNLCDLFAARDGLLEAEQPIRQALSRAAELLCVTTEGGDPAPEQPDAGENPYADPGKRDGRYAYVCEKCAPVFGYYGYFLAEQELSRRAQRIYERN